MFALTSFAAGLLFGGGLAVSGLLDPDLIHSVLNIGAGWCPHAAIVFVIAVIVTMMGYRFARARGAPLFGARLAIPLRDTIDKRLVIGAAIFGLGWGIAGLCPRRRLPGSATAISKPSLSWSRCSLASSSRTIATGFGSACAT